MNKKWVSVKDRLPITDEFGESEYILCCPEIGPLFVGWYCLKKGGFIVSHHKADSMILYGADAPTHWMPLPEPPKTK